TNWASLPLALFADRSRALVRSPSSDGTPLPRPTPHRDAPIGPSLDCQDNIGSYADSPGNPISVRDTGSSPAGAVLLSPHKTESFPADTDNCHSGHHRRTASCDTQGL